MSQTTKEFMAEHGYTRLSPGGKYLSDDGESWVSGKTANRMHQLFIEGQIEALGHINKPSMLGIETIKKEIATLTKDLAAIKEGKI